MCELGKGGALVRRSRWMERLPAAALTILLAGAVSGCATLTAQVDPPGGARASAPSVVEVPATDEEVLATDPPADVEPTGNLDVALVVALDDAETVGLALWELLDDGLERGLDDHPWTTSLEDLDAAFEEAALERSPEEAFEVTATPMSVAALLVSLDREASFYEVGGIPEEAERYVVAAAHVREQLTVEQAAEIERCATEPLPAFFSEDADG
jgi:hypothetical protein